MPDSKSKVETLRWRDGRLEMIDQRVLPSELRYLQFDSAAAVADGIRSMVVRGAPAIGCAAAYGVALEALRLQHARSPDSAPDSKPGLRRWRQAAPPPSTCSGRSRACAMSGRL